MTAGCEVIIPIINRILESVSGSRKVADDVLASLDAGRVEKWLVHADPYGNVVVGVVDRNGRLRVSPEQVSRILVGK